MPPGPNLRLLAFLLACLPRALPGHGGVVAGEDLCVLEIGVYTAHFTIYQPETRASEEFCEDVPGTGRTVFVMDYLHDSLRDVPVGFRVIRDVLGSTLYASADDLRRIGDLDAATVFHQRPRIEPDASYTVEHPFTEEGWYIGIVTAGHPTLDRTYQAVFGFHVGDRGWGFWPWLLVALVAAQLTYWGAGGGFRRWLQARRGEASGEA